MDIGNQIKEHRQRLGLSQEELAQRLYVSRVTVSHWETSKTLPDVQSMLLLANLFGTTIDELVRGDVDEMREMVEKNERRTRTFAVALAAVEVVVITALAVTAVAGRDYLEPVLRLLLAGLAVGIGVLVAGDVLLDPATFRKLAVAAVVAAALAGSFALGRLARPAWTAAILPALWVAGAVALGAATGGLGSPRDWLTVVGGAVVLLAFWAIGRRRRE